MIAELLSGVSFPRFARVTQTLEQSEIVDAREAILASLRRPGLLSNIQPGDQVAIAVGSRETPALPEILRTIGDVLRERGAMPFIVPGMGSHGGATAEGQEQVLACNGITAETTGMPIRSCMDTVEIGRTVEGLPVRIDRLANDADWIIPVGRVKPHTDFRGQVESGVMKMLAIGLGKQYGAQICHQFGFENMAKNVWEFGRVMIANCHVAFGVAVLENARHRLSYVEAIPAIEIETREPELLDIARTLLPRIPFDNLDVLVVGEMGKEISGAGMDPNITGRSPQLGIFHPYVQRIAVLDLTEKSHGNAAGMGNADFITQRLRDKVDFTPIYINGLTSRDTTGFKLPCVMPTDDLAIRASLHTCTRPGERRVVCIRNTASLGELYVSESLLAEAMGNPALMVCGEPASLPFDAVGNLLLTYRGNE